MSRSRLNDHINVILEFHNKEHKITFPLLIISLLTKIFLLSTFFSQNTTTLKKEEWSKLSKEITHETDRGVTLK